MGLLKRSFQAFYWTLPCSHIGSQSMGHRVSIGIHFVAFFSPVPSSRLMKLCQQRALEEHGKRKDLLRLVLVLLSFHFSCLWLQFGWASRWGHPGGPMPYMDVRNKEPPLYHASSPNIQNPDGILHLQAQISDAWTSWHTHGTLTLMLLSLVLNYGTAVFLQHWVSMATVS